MRQGNNQRRPRRPANQPTGGGRRNNVPLRHQNFDSNGPDVRIRGNAYQVHEKYLQLARDATAAGDRITAENYFQHAEHYYRIILQINEQMQADQRNRHPNGPPNGPMANGGHAGNGSVNGNGMVSDGEDDDGDYEDDAPRMPM